MTDKTPYSPQAASKSEQIDGVEIVGSEADAVLPADHVRVAGRKKMDLPPKSWDIIDEQGDESFPASDPPGNY